MDGIELIEALRQVPALAAIPVVMMTAAREQGPVHRAIELGVTDYLLKPLQAERVADRLKAVIDRVTRASDGPGEDDRTPVLVADGNAEFRQFVAHDPRAAAHRAPGAVRRRRAAARGRDPPGIVLVGGELGLLGPALLMRKLRAAGELAGTRIIAVVPKRPTPPSRSRPTPWCSGRRSPRSSAGSWPRSPAAPARRTACSPRTRRCARRWPRPPSRSSA